MNKRHVAIVAGAGTPFAKALLRSKDLPYEEIDVTHDAKFGQEMIHRSQRRSVPQIFIDGVHIGGSDDLSALNARSELDQMVNKLKRQAA